MGMTDKQFNLQLRIILDDLEDIRAAVQQDRKEEALTRIGKLSGHLQVTIED